MLVFDKCFLTLADREDDKCSVVNRSTKRVDSLFDRGVSMGTTNSDDGRVLAANKANHSRGRTE